MTGTILDVSGLEVSFDIGGEPAVAVDRLGFSLRAGGKPSASWANPAAAKRPSDRTVIRINPGGERRRFCTMENASAAGSAVKRTGKSPEKYK